MSLIKYGISELADVVRRLKSHRVLLVTGDSSRFADRVLSALPGVPTDVFNGARRHVPNAVVEAALARLDGSAADLVVSLGGGSATGLGKVLRLNRDIRFVAIPTTYSGSERTNIHAVTATEDGVAVKRTGRDDRVRPDVVVYDVDLMLDMPVPLTVTSLMNAMAHAVSVLCRDDSSDERVGRAISTVVLLFGAVESLVTCPRDRVAREQALRGAGEAARLLEDGALGEHHEFVHLVGGTFDVDHGALHSVLLPYTVNLLRQRHPHRMAKVDARLGVADLEGQLFDLLRRASAATKLSDLSIAPRDLWAVLPPKLIETASPYRLALEERQVSSLVRFETFGEVLVAAKGASLSDAKHIVLALHGRGSDPETILRRANDVVGCEPGVLVLAPCASLGEWYAGSHSDETPERAETLERALGSLTQLVDAIDSRFPGSRLSLFGFSQGACVALELLVRCPGRFRAVVALSGSLLQQSERRFVEVASPTSVLLGTCEDDPCVSASLVRQTGQVLKGVGHDVTTLVLPGSQHRILALHRVVARRVLSGLPLRTLSGFGSIFETEALPGAVPKDQNSPRRVPYGLYAEQVNGSPFAVPRARNRRSWFYRVRPSASQLAYTPYLHDTLCVDLETQSFDPNLLGWRPIPFPVEPTDFVDGLVTIGGAGDDSQRRGYSVHWYALNRSMEDRAFSNADGDLLIIPQLGQLTLLTEQGVLELGVGEVAVLPRGLRFSVLCATQHARGFVAEVFGRHFELPERGVIGANGLADARHFRAPVAGFEDRLAPRFEIVTKAGNRLWHSSVDYSPFDVAGWHGNYAPFVYDLRLFTPVSMVRTDHSDPSIHTVLSVPLDESGQNLLDLVVFAPRWDATEHTFRPPYFHRNATTEFNGLIASPRLDGNALRPGASFLSPPMTPHGVRARDVESSLLEDDAVADVPQRIADESLWFQLESCLPMKLSAVAKKCSWRVTDWRAHWGAYRTHFRPTP